MVISFLQILQESVKKLLPGSPREAAALPPAAIFAMVSTVVVKGIIWVGCARIKTTQVQALSKGKYYPTSFWFRKTYGGSMADDVSS